MKFGTTVRKNGKTRTIRTFLLTSFALLLSSCALLQGNKNRSTSENTSNLLDFGVFLGLKEENTSKLLKYENVAIEIEEFSKENIKKIKDNGTKIYSYLSIGSLEKYKPYYDEFSKCTFMDYENWPDERWIDVSQSSWQDKLLSLATSFKALGSDGLFLDNFDVYYIASEEYECSDAFKEGIYKGCKDILTKLKDLDLKVMINSGTTFLERLEKEKDPLLDKIDWYAQECVFSKIDDYEKDIFSKQDKEDHDYYVSMVRMMKRHSKVLIIEYTKDESLIKDIFTFVVVEDISYFISNTVNLE